MSNEGEKILWDELIFLSGLDTNKPISNADKTSTGYRYMVGKDKAVINVKITDHDIRDKVIAIINESKTIGMAISNIFGLIACDDE